MNPYHEALLLTLNLLIVFCWIFFSMHMGIIALICSILIVLWTAAHANFPTYNLHILLLIITVLITNYFAAKDRSNRRFKNMTIEELKEEKNSLQTNLEEQNTKIPALNKKLTRYTALKDVTERFNLSLSLSDVADITLEEVGTILDKSGRIILFLIDEDKQQLIPFRYKEDKREKDVTSVERDIFDSYILKQRKPLIINDTSQDFRFNSDEVVPIKDKVRSLVSVPLVAEQRVIGVLRVDNNQTDTYSADDLRVLDIIASLAATAIKNAQLYMQMEKLAITDGLTGLFVHRYFHQRFEEELNSVDKNKTPMSLLMLDIDHFKKYNDRYGHTAGDLVLIHITKLISSLLGNKDIIARYGGEEFAIVLINTDKDKAASMADKIRENVEKQVIVLRREKTNVTISIGIASFPQDGVGKEELIEKADSALYKAKKTGRNRVCIC